MNLNLVKDPNGSVIATFEDGVQGGPSLQPVLKAGHTVTKIQAPENYKADLKTLYAQNSRQLVQAGR